MGYIVSFFLNIVSWVIALAKEVFILFLTYFYECVDAILLPVAESIPDLNAYFSSFDSIAPYFYFANNFVAFNVGASLVTAYLIFLICMITVKLIVKLFIPTVG